jgi:hypothetical protein
VLAGFVLIEPIGIDRYRRTGQQIHFEALIRNGYIRCVERARHTPIGRTDQPLTAEQQLLTSHSRGNGYLRFEFQFHESLAQIDGIGDGAGRWRRIVTSHSGILRFGEKAQPGSGLDAQIQPNSA